MSTPTESSMLAVGTVLIGIYRIECHLSSGGFGNTYVATNLTFGDRVAVKEFFMRGITQRDGNSTISVSNPDNRAMFQEQLEKFKKEAQRIRQLRSPHIVRVHDMFDANGTAYYVMDYIDGESLSARLKRTKRPLDEAAVRRYLGQLLDGLESIHSAGLLHMDLKPENIMIDQDDDAVLIDFGASKRMDCSRYTATMTGVSYTNGYAPPEQLEQDPKHFGTWTDIYALGATLYKLLTDRKPPMPSAIYADSTSDKHESLPFPPGVSTSLRRVIVQMLAVRWNARPQSIAALRNILRQNNAGTYNDESTRMMGTISVNKATNTEQYNGDTDDSSSKWLYAVIGALAAGIVAMFLVLLLRKEDTPNTATVAERPLQETAAPETSSQDLVLEEPSTDKRDAIVRGIVNNMVSLNGGSFLMGATSEQSAGAGDDEWPVHNVTLSSFRIGRCEVTQEEWQAVMGNNPSRFRGARRPVDNVSWRDCQTFIKKLNDLSGKHFRLPTEAEWEFAARGGNNSRGYTYSGSNSVGSVAWYSATSGSRTHEVGSKSPNELGLYDMTGNLWEWCSDWYGSYDSDGQVDPTGPYSSSTRAIRGGGWNGGPDNCRVANRDGRAPGYRSDRLGLRLAMDE